MEQSSKGLSNMVSNLQRKNAPNMKAIEKDSYLYYGALPGLRSVKWPVRITEEGMPEPGKVWVYCRCDDALFQLRIEQLKKFPDDKIYQKGIAFLKKKKMYTTLQKYKEDVQWAEEGGREMDTTEEDTGDPVNDLEDLVKETEAECSGHLFEKIGGKDVKGDSGKEKLDIKEADFGNENDIDNNLDVNDLEELVKATKVECTGNLVRKLGCEAVKEVSRKEELDDKEADVWNETDSDSNLDVHVNNHKELEKETEEECTGNLVEKLDCEDTKEDSGKEKLDDKEADGNENGSNLEFEGENLKECLNTFTGNENKYNADQDMSYSADQDMLKLDKPLGETEKVENSENIQTSNKEENYTDKSCHENIENLEVKAGSDVSDEGSQKGSSEGDKNVSWQFTDTVTQGSAVSESKATEFEEVANEEDEVIQHSLTVNLENFGTEDTGNEKDEVLGQDGIENQGFSQFTEQIVPSKGSRSSKSDKRLALKPERAVKVITASGLSRLEKNELKRLSGIEDFELYAGFNSSVTHVIIKTDPHGSRLCEAVTLKFLQGVAYGCWLLDFSYVCDSLSSGHLLPEEEYEIVGENSCGETYGPRKSRLNSDYLLKDWEIYITGGSDELPNERLEELITVCGGEVVSTPEEFTDTSYCLVLQNSDDSDIDVTQQAFLDDLYRSFMVPVVSRMWFTNSLTHYKLQDLDDYLLTEISREYGTVEHTEEELPALAVEVSQPNIIKRALIDPTTGELGLFTEDEDYDELEGAVLTGLEREVELGISMIRKERRQLIDPKTGDLEYVSEMESDEQSFPPDSTTDNTSAADKGEKQSNIVVQAVAKDYKGKRDYSKTHCCYYCGKYLTKMSRHLEKCHKSETEVKNIAKLPSENSGLTIEEVRQIEEERRLAQDQLRNLGDFYGNVETISKKAGVLIVGKRNKHSCADDYLPCSLCYVFFLKSELWRHTKKCKSRKKSGIFADKEDEKKAEKHFIETSRLLLYGAGGHVWLESFNEEYYTCVLSRLHVDDISMAVKSDALITEFGKVQFEKLGIQRASEVRSKLRILGRLKLKLREVSSSEDAKIEEFLTPERFDLCVTGVKQLCEVQKGQSLSGTEVFLKPDLALKAGQLMKKLATLKRGKALRCRDTYAKQDAVDFIDLYEGEWCDKIGGLARQTIAERKYNKKEVIPLTEDIVKLSNALEKSVSKEMRELQKTVERNTWCSLAKTVLARVTIFNKRRGEEPSKMLLSSFEKRKKPEHHNAEIKSALNQVELHLLDRMQLVEVLGKQKRKVPVLLAPDMVKAIELLVSTRTAAGVPSENQYIFPQGSRNHLRGCHCIREAADNSDLKRPDLISSTKLRKYMATVAQVLNMSEGDLAELARHMGHELSVHRQFYRLQEDITELSKISKLLLLVDKGQAHQYSGRNLDDIQVEDLFLEMDEEEMDEEEVSLEKRYEEKESNSELAVIGKRKRIQVSSDDSEDGEMEDLDGESDHGMDVDWKPNNDDVSEDDFIVTSTVKKSKQRKSKKQKVQRSKWTEMEMNALIETLLPDIKRFRKPPKKMEILRAQEIVPILKGRHWKAVKFRVWALFQKMENVAKKLLK